MKIKLLGTQNLRYFVRAHAIEFNRSKRIIVARTLGVPLYYYKKEKEMQSKMSSSSEMIIAENHPIKHSLSEQCSMSEPCNPSDGQISSEETETSSHSEMDGSKPFFPHTDHEGTSNSRRNSGNDINMSHHMGDNDFGAHYAAMIQNGQYPHPYDPYSTHTIIGQSGLPLSIPFGLLQYAQFQEDTRLAKNKGLRRGKWTVRRLSQCSFIHMNCSCYFFSYVVFIVMMMLF